MKQEPPDEFLSGQSYNIAFIAGGAVAEGKGDLTVLDVENAVVGDGDAVGIAAEVVENFIRSSERGLGINDPALLAEPGEQAGESGPGLELSGLPRENKLALSIGVKEEVQILSAKDQGESSDGEEKFLRGVDPACVIFG